MDSDTSDDMASGSKARDRGLKGDKVPQWKSVSKTTFAEWWYEMDSYSLRAAFRKQTTTAKLFP